MSVRSHRVIVVIVSRWAIRLAGFAPDALAIVEEAGRVYALTKRAERTGVGIGMRVRRAAKICPNASWIERDPGLESSAFRVVLDAMGRSVAHALEVRPGVGCVGARGPARFWGSELAAAQKIYDDLAQAGFPEAQVGIADGLFAAEQAAREGSPIRIIEAGRSQAFLRPVSVLTLHDRTLARTLQLLGFDTLADFSTLTKNQVRSRFGAVGVEALCAANAQDAPVLVSRAQDDDHVIESVFDEPCRGAEHVVEQMSGRVKAWVDEIGRGGYSLVGVNISIEHGAGVSERVWRHLHLGSSDILARLAWQLADLRQSISAAHGWDETAGVRSVRIRALTQALGHGAQGLFGDRPSEHLVSIITALQAKHGQRCVLTPAIQGDRFPHQRRQFVPFGEAGKPATQLRLDEPWQGQPVGPRPATVLVKPQLAQVVSPQGEPIVTDGLGLSAQPSQLMVHQGRGTDIVAWAGPWPVRQRWWSLEPSIVDRFQFVTADSAAWLVSFAAGRWWIEARYD